MASRVHRRSRAVVYLLLLRLGSIHLQSWVVSGSASARGAVKLGAIEYRMRELQLLVEWDANLSSMEKPGVLSWPQIRWVPR